MKKKRDILIGLDGVPFLLIDRFTRRGIMPNLRQFIFENSFFKMKSTIPDVSNVAWSSVITGELPGEHGIFGFMEVNPRNYSLYFPDSRDLKAKPFWNNYEKALVINVPSTYPAHPINGVLISGFVSIDFEGAVYPKSLIPELRAMGYRIDVNNSLARESPTSFIEDLHKTLEIRLKFLEKMWDRDEWDLIVFVITGTDRLNHFFMDAMSNNLHPYKKTFEEYYNLVDKVIGRILSRTKVDDNVIIFSEHGAEELEIEFYVNKFLYEKGYLKYKNSDPKTPVDLAPETKAFCLDPGRVYINSTDRFLFGRLTPEQKENLMIELQILFKNLVIDGKKIVKKVYQGRNLYIGKYAKLAPDLVLVPEKGVDLKGRIYNQKMTDKRIFKGKHRHDNAFIVFKRNNSNTANLVSEFSVEKIVTLLKK